MKFTAKAINIRSLKTDCLVVVAFTDGKLTNAAKQLEKISGLSLSSVYDQGEFKGSNGQMINFYQPTQHIHKAIMLGLGDKEKITANSFRKAMSSLATSLLKPALKRNTICVDEVDIKDWDSEHKAHALAQATVYASYQFTQCKSGKKDKTQPQTIQYGTQHSRQANKGLATGKAIADGMNVARELGNLPGNICTPSYLATEARKLTRKHKTLKTQILSEKQMAAMGMGSLLSVSAGSKQPAQLIVMEYQGTNKGTKPHVLVGKGITFDTGGISLKPGAAMDEMKFDMCGAASVFGAITSLLNLQAKINVVGIVAAAENMPGSQATKPGDIVTSMSGKTIEVLNTDAEGRLVLCDALTYAERYKPKSVIDIATLTGACVVALGKHATGLFSNSDELAESLLAAGIASGDRAWHMPLWDDYQKQLDSNFADIANIGGRDGGSITAACFLSRFAGKFKHWAHLDIAGTGWHSGANKGASGRPVPLLIDYLLNRAD